MEEQKQEEQKQQPDSGNSLKEIVMEDSSCSPSINKFMDKYLEFQFDETFYLEFEELDETEKDDLHNLVCEYAYSCEFMNSFSESERVYSLARFLRKMSDESMANPVFK